LQFEGHRASSVAVYGVDPLIRPLPRAQRTLPGALETQGAQLGEMRAQYAHPLISLVESKNQKSAVFCDAARW
jgi:hypothetical protein